MAKRSPFPLQWPDGFKRTPAAARTKSRFGYRGSGQVGLAQARDQLLHELQLLGAANVVITTDLPVRNDGLPYADGRAQDPGVAVWLVLSINRQWCTRVFACDRWKTHAENLMAIAKSVEAMRGLERWGMADVVERTMGGFTALPSGEQEPPPAKKPWREVLNVPNADLDSGTLLVVAKHRHRELSKQHHPDRPDGNADLMLTINLALAEAEAELEQKGEVLRG